MMLDQVSELKYVCILTLEDVSNWKHKWFLW